MTTLKQKKKEQLHFHLFKRLYKQFPDGKVYHQRGQRPDFLIEHSNGILGIEHTEIFKSKPTGQPYNPQQQEGFLRKIVDQAKIICEKKGVDPLQVKVWFKGINHITGTKDQSKLSESLAEFVESWNKKSPDAHELLKPQAKIPEISQIDIRRGTLNGKIWLTSHRWSKEGAGWVKRQFIEELQKCLDEKNDKYEKYRKKCEECWLLVVANRSNPAQCFDIDFGGEVKAHNYYSKFDKTFYMEVMHRYLVKLNCSP